LLAVTSDGEHGGHATCLVVRRQERIETMDQELPKAWERLQAAMSAQQGVSALTMGVYLLLAGAFGLYLRMLFRRGSVSASDSEAITRVFPLLTLITTGVIAVVKSSLALSLGLVGALSIVRFRSAIKEPEELVYLFLCVAVGLALGAELPLLAFLLVAVATIFVLILRVQGRRNAGHSLLLTITGETQDGFSDGECSIFAAVRELAGPFTLQRLDLENGRGQIRVILRRMEPQHTAQLITELKQRLPDCDFSCVNVNLSL